MHLIRDRIHLKSNKETTMGERKICYIGIITKYRIPKKGSRKEENELVNESNMAK